MTLHLYSYDKLTFSQSKNNSLVFSNKKRYFQSVTSLQKRQNLQLSQDLKHLQTQT